MAKRWYTVKTAAEELELSERTIEREIEAGRLGHVNVGRAVRITKAQMDDYERRKEIESGWQPHVSKPGRAA